MNEIDLRGKSIEEVASIYNSLASKYNKSDRRIKDKKTLELLKKKIDVKNKNQ